MLEPPVMPLPLSIEPEVPLELPLPSPLVVGMSDLEPELIPVSAWSVDRSSPTPFAGVMVCFSFSLLQAKEAALKVRHSMRAFSDS